MRVVVTTSALEGHFFPMVPLAWALRAAGHDVLVSAPGNFTGAVTGTGLHAAGFVDPIEFEAFMLRDRAGRPLTPPANPRERHASGGRAWGRLAAMQLKGTQALFEAWHPDLVISEPNEYAGRMLARRYGVPCIEHSFGIMGMPEFVPAATEELAPELEALGLDSLPDPDLFVDTCPAPLTEPGDPGGLVMRYVPYNGAALAPDWIFEERSRPRIALTFGGVLPRHGRRDFRGMLRDWTLALPALGAEVVVAVADDLTAQWSPLPDGVRAAGWLPMNLTLPACDVVIHHGGAGTTMTAALAGVPQLITPQLVDQFTNARRISGAGAGLSLQPEELETTAVVEQCRRLLAESAFAERAADIGRANAERPTPAAVVAELEAFAAGAARAAAAAPARPQL